MAKRMSRNDVFIVKQIDDVWHGWCTTAEQVVSDKDDKRRLHLSESLQSKSVDGLHNKLIEAYGFSEYGMITQLSLPKDGTPVEVVA